MEETKKEEKVEQEEQLQKDFITAYFEANEEARVEIILKNYSNFPAILDSGLAGVIYLANEEIDYFRRKQAGESLGIRSNTVSNPTYREAVKEISVEEAIRQCKFDNGALDDTEHKRAFIQRAYDIRKMRRDYEAVVGIIKNMEDSEREVLLTILMSKKDMKEVASDFQIEYSSLYSRLHRLKGKVKETTVPLYTKNLSWLQ